MTDSIKPEEKILLRILSDIFNGDNLPDNMTADWDAILAVASKHGVLPLLYDILQNQKLTAEQKIKLHNSAKSTTISNYRLFFLTHYLLNTFSAAGIPVVVIKGVSVSDYYPVPEYRKSCDIDFLLLDESRLQESCEIFESLGMIPDTSEAVHHICWKTSDDIEIEFHTMMIEPGKREEFNQCFKDQLIRLNGKYIKRNIGGYDFQVLPDGYQAYELLLHMLHHFIREGFGLKLLCDWVAFWNHPVQANDIEQYLELIKEIHLESFSRIITSVCYIYLGMQGCSDGIYVKSGKFMYSNGVFCDILPVNQTELFLNDILEGGEFGKSSNDRLVTMNAPGLSGYFSEFHYAMRRKFPKSGKYFITWPVLWIATLIIFIKENKQNNRNGLDIMKKSSERSQMIKDLELFK